MVDEIEAMRWMDDGGLVATEADLDPLATFPERTGFDEWFERTFIEREAPDGSIDLYIYPSEKYPLALHATQVIELARRLNAIGMRLMSEGA